MPAYADGKDVVCFVQGAARFDTRYATIGFNDRAQLDDGDMWPVTFAIVDWSDAVQARVEELVRTAVGWRPSARDSPSRPHAYGNHHSFGSWLKSQCTCLVSRKVSSPSGPSSRPPPVSFMPPNGPA
jgi:hypothetical protein